MSSTQLPDELNYLQPVLDALASLAPDDLHEETDTIALEVAVKRRIEGMSFEDAEERIETDQQLLRDWLSGPGKDQTVAFFMLGWISPFIVGELHEDA